jgi:hypothetical protein
LEKRRRLLADCILGNSRRYIEMVTLFVYLQVECSSLYAGCTVGCPPFAIMFDVLIWLKLPSGEDNDSTPSTTPFSTCSKIHADANDLFLELREVVNNCCFSTVQMIFERRTSL